jgi:hypothetical protein
MKLKKEDFNKTINPDGSVSYDYTCKDNTYHIRVVGYGVDRTMFVYKNDEFDTDLQNVFSTKDNLLAWEEFERQVNACNPKPQSSGGFKKNPQANPFALPLLAIKFDTNISKWKIVFFLQVNSGQQVGQVNMMDFTLESNEFTMPIGNAISEVDWTNYNVPDIFKSVIMLKKFDKVVFEEDQDADVFLFIPKSIIQPPQGGGEPPEPPQGGGEPPEPPQGGGEPPEPPQGGGEPPEPPQGGGEPPEPPQGGGEPPENGKPIDEYSYRQPQKEQKRNEVEDSDLLKALANSLGVDVNVISSFFTRVKQGEVFLNSQNFEKIKSDLGLPSGTTPLQLSQTINQQLQ